MIGYSSDCNVIVGTHYLIKSCIMECLRLDVINVPWFKVRVKRMNFRT